jgi:opacity protein-like surface antigen
MRKLLILCGVFLCLSMTAAAQDAPAALDTSSPAGEPAAPVTFYPSDRAPWQLGFGYQYTHYKTLGQTFHNNGFRTDVTRYLNDWLGLEGAVAAGFGHIGAPLNIVAKSVFVGGGPHIAAHNNSRYEPWGHVLVGLQHFRFTQTNDVIGLGSNSALGFMVGGGVDLKLGRGISWRFQADFIGTHFRSATQTNFSFGSGLVFNF